MTRIIVAALLLFAAGIPAPAPARTPDVQTVSAADQVQIDLAIARGRLLYAYDQAAWHGTDDALAKLGHDAAARVGGWIIDGPAEAPQLVFFDRSATPQAVYVATFANGRLVSGKVLGDGDDRTLDAGRQRLIAARAAALKAFADAHVATCAPGPDNTVVLPPASPGAPVLVYLLTPQPDMKTVPFGGHFRVEVAADGTTANLRPFTKSCLNMPIAAPGGGRPAMAFITHLLDPVPTEIHVFSSLVIHEPVVVGIPSARGKSRTWIVDGASIRPGPEV